MGDKAVGAVIEEAIENLGITPTNTINLIGPCFATFEDRILSILKTGEYAAPDGAC